MKKVCAWMALAAALVARALDGRWDKMHWRLVYASRHLCEPAGLCPYDMARAWSRHGGYALCELRDAAMQGDEHCRERSRQIWRGLCTDCGCGRWEGGDLRKAEEPTTTPEEAGLPF